MFMGCLLRVLPNSYFPTFVMQKCVTNPDVRACMHVGFVTYFEKTSCRNHLYSSNLIIYVHQHSFIRFWLLCNYRFTLPT